MKAQEKTNQINFEAFTEVFSKIIFEAAEDRVNKIDCSTGELKGLTADIMGFVSEDNNVELMNRIAAKVESWSKDKTLIWKNSLVEYGRTSDDIEAIYCKKKEGASEIIVVADHSGGEAGLRHNDFCFELFDQYQDINDFMVLDREEFDGMKSYYRDFVKIYQRG